MPTPEVDAETIKFLSAAMEELQRQHGSVLKFVQALESRAKQISDNRHERSDES